MAFSRFSLCTAAVVLGCAAGLAQAQAYVNGSISGQLAPGVYGRVDIGNAPPPALLYAQPMVAMPPAVVMPSPQPVYMWVPPGHAKHWRKHCARYNACGQPVYFLRNPPPHWGAPHYREPRPDWRRPPPPPHMHERGYERHDHGRRDWERRHDDHGRGHGRGHGQNHQ